MTQNFRSPIFAIILVGVLGAVLFEIPTVEGELIEVPEVAWIRQFGAQRDDIGRAVAVDDTGIFVTGVMDPDAFVRKLDFNGGEVWTHVFATDGGGSGYGIDVDATGIYVVGMLEPRTFEYHAFIKKFDAAGNEVWSNVSQVPGEGSATGVVAHSSGVYFVGSAGPDAFLRRFTLDGSEVWTRLLSTEGEDRLWGVGADDTGVYAFGKTTGAFPGYTNLGSFDRFLAKFDHDGNQVWLRQFGTSSDDDSNGIDMDGSGIYVIGTTGDDVVLGKYDVDGTEAWSRRYGESVIELAEGVSADASSIFAASTENYSQAVLRKYDADGNLIWSRKFYNDGHTQARSVRSHDSGVYLTGYTDGAFPGEDPVGWSDVFVLRLVLPAISMDPVPLDFGEVDVRGNETRTVTITSVGDASLTVNDIGLADGNRGFSVQAPPEFPLILPPGETADIVVSFAPLVAGSSADSLRIVTGNDSVEGVVTVPLSGTALAVLPTKPEQVSAIAGEVRVDLTWEPPWSDGGLPITNYRLYRGTASGFLAVLREIGPEFSLVDTNLVSGQTYYYQVTAINTVGEGPPSVEVSATPTAPPDTTGPSVAISSPAVGAIVASATVTLSGTASDNVAVQKVEFSADETRWILTTGTTSWLGTLTLAEGTNTIYVRVTDTSGNTATATTMVTVDTIDPDLDIAAPASGSVVASSEVRVWFSTGDATSGVDHVEIRIDGGPATVIGSAATSHTITGLSDGPHTVEVTVFDRAGNLETVTVTFRVDTSFLSPFGPYGITGIVTLSIVLAVSIVAFVAFWRRKGRV